MCQFHHAGSIIEDVTQVNNVVLPLPLSFESIFDEINAVVELVMSKLGEVQFQHNRETLVGDVWRDFGV